jgi:hypothetical protein
MQDTASKRKSVYYEASHFVLRDNQGRLRADFCITDSKHQSPGIWFLDAAEKKRMFLGLNQADAPIIYFLNEDGDLVENIGLASSGAGSGRLGQFLKEPEVIWPDDLYEIYYCENRMTSKTFHQKTCARVKGKYLREISIKVAREKGMLPCKDCCPHLWKKE